MKGPCDWDERQAHGQAGRRRPRYARSIPPEPPSLAHPRLARDGAQGGGAIPLVRPERV